MKKIVLFGLFLTILGCEENKDGKIGKVERTNELSEPKDTMSLGSFSFDSSYLLQNGKGNQFEMKFKNDSIFIEFGSFIDEGKFYTSDNILCFTMKSQGWEQCFEMTDQTLENSRQRFQRVIIY
jgi:hypothetical protein